MANVQFSFALDFISAQGRISKYGFVLIRRKWSGYSFTFSISASWLAIVVTWVLFVVVIEVNNNA